MSTHHHFLINSLSSLFVASAHLSLAGHEDCSVTRIPGAKVCVQFLLIPF